MFKTRFLLVFVIFKDCIRYVTRTHIYDYILLKLFILKHFPT